MKKIIKICLLFIGFNLCFFGGTFSRAKDYEYKNLDIIANINADGTVDVNETFTANFFERKHGIIRVIPLNYSVSGKKFHIDVSNIYVNGLNFTTSNSRGNIEIKIGDADRTVIGEQIYPIFYSVYGLIRNFSGMGYAELYRNLVGYDFDTNIDSVRAELYLPKTYTGFTSDDFLITTNGETKTVKDFAGDISWRGGDKITVTYNKSLQAGEGITLAIKFPNDYFEFDHDKQSSLIGDAGGDLKSKLLNFGLFSWKYFLFAGIFFVLALLSMNKNPKIKKSEIETKLNNETPIVVRYTPPEGVNCAEAGMLYNCILEPTDLTSLVYKWAIEGLISIEIDKDTGYSTVRRFVMTKLKNIEANKPQYEIDFFDSLLPREVNSKKTLSSTSEFDIVWSLKSLRNYGKSKGWITVGGFDDSKNIVIGFVLLIILFFVLYKLGIRPEIAGFVSIFVFAIFSSGSSSSPTQKKISLTEEGKIIASEVIGYAHFLKLCDENKLRLFLEKDPMFFDKTLPYAVAFGFETMFINKITPILRELDIKPVRYDGEVNDLDYVSRVVRDMIRTQELRRAKERESSSTYDSGGGFSSGSSFGGGFSHGGGGGGGGSRSW